MIVDICSTVVVFPRNDGLIGSEFVIDLRIINPKTKIISLPITIVESQMGKYSREDNNRKAVSIKILSAAGSSILPSGVISFLLLARYPSIPSAILAIAKKTRAKPLNSYRMEYTNKGTRISLASVTLFANVRFLFMKKIQKIFLYK